MKSKCVVTVHYGMHVCSAINGCPTGGSPQLTMGKTRLTRRQGDTPTASQQAEQPTAERCSSSSNSHSQTVAKEPPSLAWQLPQLAGMHQCCLILLTMMMTASPVPCWSHQAHVKQAILIACLAAPRHKHIQPIHSPAALLILIAAVRCEDINVSPWHRGSQLLDRCWLCEALGRTITHHDESVPPAVL
jgi:hypothetical protein